MSHLIFLTNINVYDSGMYFENYFNYLLEVRSGFSDFLF